MRKACILCAAFVIVAAGCVELPLVSNSMKSPSAAERREPVTAGEVTTANAHEIAHALDKELDVEDAGLVPNPAVPPASH
jgi:hypothetical protein